MSNFNYNKAFYSVAKGMYKSHKHKLNKMCKENKTLSIYGIVPEKIELLEGSEELKAIEWLNEKRKDTSLSGIEMHYLNILYYLILNLSEASNETK